MDSSSVRTKSTPKASNSFDKAMGLPKDYGDTKIMILPRDPLWLYAYWEVAAETNGKVRQKLGDNKFNSSRWILRVYDVTGIKFDGLYANRYFDVVISSGADNWYVNVREADRNWCVDLGMITPEGEFIVIARSNILTMPHRGVSPIMDEQWAMLEHEFELLLKLSGVEQVGKSSFDIAKLMREKWEEIVSISLPSSHIGASSWKGKSEVTKPKGFRLKADTELVVYGTTEPDARLTVQGQKVSLRNDGCFSLRFYLLDGKQEYPIEAISSNGTMKRKITFTVTKDTIAENY
jgi:uncharacterized protein